MLHFQLKPVWKSSSFLGHSMIMNKKSQFTKIFSQGILEMKETGTVEIMYGKRVHQMEDNLPKPKEKSLGYKKLAFLFAALASGTIISLFVVFLENIAKLYLEKHQSTSTTIHTKQNSIDDRINEILEDMSNSETEETFQRILQQPIKRFNI